jgi:hypothetical protein
MAFPTDWEESWPAQMISATAVWKYLALAFDYR